MNKKIPIGISDFKKIIDDNYYFVDKSLFIKEVVEDGSEVTLIPRPRRFGKTLNMSMLKYFYEKDEKSNDYLFEGLEIYKHHEIMSIQGKYPVIYITFKDEKHSSWDKCRGGFERVIRDEFIRHDYLLDDENLKDYEREEIMHILTGNASYITYLNGLKILTKYLYRFHNKKVVVLIDEYDVPIQSGYINGYYDEVIEFMRNFFSGGLKDNVYLEKSVLTGILRVAKESIFSGLNNLSVSTLMSYSYSDRFGFLDEEVEKVIMYYNKNCDMKKIREWYNGYVFGEKIIYNPWSILNFIRNEKEGFKPYWVNTSSNDLIKQVLTIGGASLKKELEQLVRGESIEKEVNESIVMHEINTDTNNAWSFLLFSGYLKAESKEVINGITKCSLKIPNLEVQYLYRDIISSWFRENISSEKFEMMLKSLVDGDIETFEMIFSEFVIKSMSYFDVSGDESEKVYHSFVLGMLLALSNEYYIKSNGESGYGRYDVMIIPKVPNRKGVIIEFKKVNKIRKQSLENCAKSAIEQIKEKKYKTELVSRGVLDILELGIAFDGKAVLVMKG